MKTILIVGLGNPGKKFVQTRHNVGFMFVDYFWKKYQGESSFSDWRKNKKLKSEISLGKAKNKKMILLKPQTFMNLSGEAVKAAIRYYKTKPSDLIVAHDEIDLPLGNYRFSTNRSSAGHKGVQNIIEALGTKNFTRLRVGIDNRAAKKIPTEKYVLGKFIERETKTIEKVFEESSKKLCSLL